MSDSFASIDHDTGMGMALTFRYLFPAALKPSPPLSFGILGRRWITATSLVGTSAKDGDVIEMNSTGDGKSSSPVKPPNVLFCSWGKAHLAKTKEIELLVRSVLAQDRYTFYTISQDDLVKTPWQDNVRLLVVDTPEKGREAASPTPVLERILVTYVKRDERCGLLYVNGKPPPELRSLPNVAYSSCDASEMRSVLSNKFKMAVSDPDNVSDAREMSVVHVLERAGSHTYLDQLPFKDGLIRLGKFNFKKQPEGEDEASGEYSVPILKTSAPLASHFDVERYRSNLRTNQIGQVCLFGLVMPSSFDLLPASPPHTHGLAVIPERQSAGKGRGGNQWLSPSGCAMFSTQLVFRLNSVMGKRLPLVQHLAALAVVHGVNSQFGEDVLRLKWPNDIYVGREAKIGGVLALSSLCGNEAVCNVGVGLNLDNEAPTLCVNAVTKKRLPKEVYFAETFNHFEHFIRLLEEGRDDEIYELYYRYWLHSRQCVEVSTQSAATEAGEGDAYEAVVDSVDEYGFLRVRRPDGETVTVQDDGNSFDMMRGLIAPKIRRI